MRYCQALISPIIGVGAFFEHARNKCINTKVVFNSVAGMFLFIQKIFSKQMY
jgi:hypothetical protein